MNEYPSIINSSKAPRKHCVAFDKLDGSNFRAKWTRKQGFACFGTRTQLIGPETPFWNHMIEVFNAGPADALQDKFKKDKDLRNEREITVYGEYYGPNSFAGRHSDEDVRNNLMVISIFDVLVGHKNARFVGPMDFIKEYQELIKIPDVIYVGNLNEELIKDVRASKYDVKEGVICKGTERTGAFSGGVWTCKIKTQQYLDKLYALYGADGLKKYGE